MKLFLTFIFEMESNMDDVVLGMYANAEYEVILYNKS